MDTRGTVTKEDLANLARRIGAQRASRVLDTLGKSQQFLNAYESPVGRELLSEINTELSRLGSEILKNPNVTLEERALFNAYLTIADSWAEKIKKYFDTVGDIKDASNG